MPRLEKDNMNLSLQKKKIYVKFKTILRDCFGYFL